MIINTQRELDKYKSVCNLSMDILHKLHEKAAVGVVPVEIDDLAQSLLKKNNAKGSFYGVRGEYSDYKYVTCISVNDVIVHGIPSRTTPLKPGDIVKLDFGLIKDGYYTDHCVTIVLSPYAEQDLAFVQASKDAVLAGVDKATTRYKTGDIGHAMHSYLTERGYDVAKEYIGHAIGRTLHERPNVPAYGRPGIGSDLKEGLVICIEAQVVEGSDKWYLEKDGWTVRTQDGKNASMFEYMVIVGKENPTILTDTRAWPITK